MTWHDTAFVFASFDTLLCLTEHGLLFLCNKRKILMMCASWQTATVLTKISFVYRAKKACPCHNHYAGNPVEGHICTEYVLWFNFIIGSNFISFVSNSLSSNYHNQNKGNKI